MAIESLLTGKRSETLGLGEVAVIAIDDMKLDVEPAEADQADDVVEADGGAAGFPSRDGGLRGPGEFRELGLRETGAPTRLADQIPAVRTHTAMITVLLCRSRVREPADRESRRAAPPGTVRTAGRRTPPDRDRWGP